MNISMFAHGFFAIRTRSLCAGFEVALFTAFFLALSAYFHVAHAAFPVVEATNSGGNTAAAASTAINLPPNVAVGNLLMVFFMKTGTAAPTSISGTGWNSLTGGAGSANYSIAYWKIADGNDSLTVNHASAKTAYVTYRITGNDPNTAPENAAGVQGSGANPNPPSLNPTNWGTEQTLWLSSFSWGPDSKTLTSYPSGYSDAQTAYATGALVSDAAIAVASKNAYVASEDPGTATLNGSVAWIARTYAIRPIATSSATYSGTLYTDVGSTTAGAGEQVTVVVPDGESITKLTDPASLPAGQAYAPAFSPDGVYVAVPHATTPFITIYKRSGDTFTKLTNPSSLPAGNGRGATFSNDGTYLAVAHETSPFITIYKRSGDTFTKLTNPSSLPAGIGYGVSFTPDGSYLAISHATSPYITVYKRDGDTFTKLADPSDLPGGSGWFTKFSPDGTHLAISLSVSPYIYIYKRDGDTFTKLADPSDLPSATSWGHEFSPDGRFLVVAQAAAPGFIIYVRSGDTFTKLTNPATSLTGDGERVAFSPDMRYLVVSHATSPFFTTYRIDGNIFTKIPNPSSLPANTARAGNFSPDGTYLPLGISSTPYIALYKFTRQNQVATDTTDANGDWSVSITLSTSSPSTLMPAMAFVSSGTTSATTIFTDTSTASVRTNIPLYGDTLLVHGTTSTSSMHRYYFYDSTDNSRVLYTATTSELVVHGGLVNATGSTMHIPPGYTLSVSGDVEQRGSFSGAGSTFHLNGIAQTVSGNFTGANALATLQVEGSGRKTFTSAASTTDLSIIGDTVADFAKLTNPSTLPTGTGWGNAVSGDGTYVMVAHANSPYVTFYRRDGDTLTGLPAPADLPTGTGLGAALSSDGTYAALAYATSSFINIYKRSGDTFTKLTAPGTLPTGSGRAAAFSSDDTYLAVAHEVSPFVTIYKRSGDTFTKLANPASLPTGIGNAVAFSADGTYLAVGHNTSPFITIYKRSGDTFTKLANPASLPPAQGNGVAFSVDGSYLAVAHHNAPYITVCSRSGDIFTKLSDPATTPTGNGRAVSFSPDGSFVAVAHLTSPFVSVYTLSANTLTKINNPGTLPASNGQGARFSPMGDQLYLSHQNSPYLTVYDVGYSPFLKLPNPATIASSTSNAADFSDDGMYMAVGYSAVPYLILYKRDGDTFTKLTDPATPPTGIVNGVSFSPNGDYLSVVHNTSPYISIYKRSGDTFTKLSDPATLPPNTGTATDFSPDGTYLSVAHNNSPYMTIYKRSGDTFTKLSDPATLPSLNATLGTSFSDDGTYLAMAGDVSPFLTIYKRSGDTFTKLTNPSTLPTDDSWAVSFSPNASYLAIVASSSPYVLIYKRSGDTFTKLPDPSDLPAGFPNGATFSPDNSYLVVSHNVSPYITIYKRDGDTFTKIANPSTLPAGNGQAAAFSPDGKHLIVAHTTFPRMSIYKVQALELQLQQALTVTASVTNNATLTSSSSVTFSGGPVAITGTAIATRFGNLTALSDVATDVDIEVTNDTSITGTFTMDRRKLYVGGDLAVTGSISAPSGFAQLNLNGAAPQTVTGSISSEALDLSITGTDAKIFTDTLALGDIFIENDAQTSAAVEFAGNTVTVNGFLSNDHDKLRFTDATVSVLKDVRNSGVLIATSSTFTFSGTKQQHASSTRARDVQFGNVTIANTSGSGSSTQSVLFGFPPQLQGRLLMLASSSAQLPSGTTTSVANLYLNGTAAASPVWLRASSLGSQALIDVNDLAEVAAYVNMRDMNNSSGYNITCYYCTNVANNSNWTFSQSGPAAVDLELDNHSQGQVPNLFSTTNVTNGSLYAFSLTATDESVDLGGFTVPVTGIRNLETSNLSNIRLWRDNNSNRSYDTGDSLIDDTGDFTISGTTGSIVFNQPFTQVGTKDYVITANTSGLAMRDSMNIKLLASNVAGEGIVTNSVVVTTGSASRAQHIISGSGSGNGRTSQIGSNPPATTPVGGGGQGSAGGGAGEVADGENFGDAFDFRAPSATGDLFNQWTNGSNALVSDGLRATANANNLKQSFSGFGFDIPAGNAVRGIGVRLDASGAVAGAGTLQVELSWNGGANTTSFIATPTLTGSDVVYTLGGQTELWGRSWTPTEFSNANFRVMVTGQNNNTLRLDAIEVRVYHEATGGGAGGGGAI